MSGPQGNYSIVRLRPLAVIADGLSEERLRDIGESLLPVGHLQVPNRDILTFGIPPASSPFNQRLIQGLTSVLSKALADSAVLVIDMNFDQTAGRYSMFAVILYQAMAALPAQDLEGKRIAILVERLPALTDDLSLLAQDARFSAVTVIADANGQFYSPTDDDWLSDTSVPQLVGPTLLELRERVSSRIVRRRGVFYPDARIESEHSAFRYSAAACTAELTALLTSYLADQFSFVIYDGMTDPWFIETIKAAANRVGIEAYSSDDLEDSGADDEHLEEVRTRARMATRDVDRRFCLIVPIFKVGRRLLELNSLCVRQGRSDATLLSIMCDVTRREVRSREAGHSSIDIRLARDEASLDYFAEVELVTLPHDDWKVVAAKINNEVEPHNDSWRRPTQVGMWSLLMRYGSDIEYEVPGSRPPVMSFPQLQILEPHDSLWLAESIVRVGEDELGCGRDNLLIVMPDELTAIRGIGDAVERRLDVAVAKVERRILNTEKPPSEKLRFQISSNSSMKIMLLDESTVSYKTLTDLNQIVRTISGRAADLFAAIVELPLRQSQRPERIISLSSWSPLRVGSIAND